MPPLVLLTPDGHSLGWDHVRAPAARDAMLASNRYCTVAPGQTALRAISLSQFLLRWMEQLQAGTCFHPGVMVRMADESVRPIELVRKWDDVLTAEGNIGTVQQVHKRHYEGPLIRLKVWGGQPVLMTPEHPVLTQQGYRDACTIKIDDWVAAPLNPGIRYVEKFGWKTITEIGHSHYEGDVHNLGVDTDNSYVAGGIGVHNCWDHAGVCLAETLGMAHGYKMFPICRRLVGWLGKQFEGGGNPSDGGTVTDALRAMTEEKGAGLAHEDLCPYTDNYRTLGTKPPQNVFDDAKASHLAMPVDVRSDDDAKVMISNLMPVSIGTWWPYNFDDRQTFMTGIGRGTYGHALTKIGYVEPGVWPGDYGKSGWWQWRNWHGQLYPPLPAELAALVPGYKSDHPDTTSDFWVRYDLDTKLQGYGNYEYVSATDLAGIDKQIVIPSFAGKLL